MRRVIIKEGPLVFLRNVLVMELILGFSLYAISFLENWQTLYVIWGIAKLIRYDIFLIVGFSIFQLVYVSLLFLDWYFSHFEVTDKEITHKSGLLFRHRKSVSLSDVVGVETYQSPLSRMMHHSTIILHHGTERITKIKNIINADDYVHILKQLTRNKTHSDSGDVSRFIREGEGRFVEFKETLRWDTRKREVGRDMEKMVMKTIVAFMNTDGGTLLIGVNDAGQVVGLENDFKTLPRKNHDGFENHISMLVKTMIGLPFAKYISIKFERLNEKEVCLVSVGESHKPAYLRNGDNKEDFFVRVGNSTQPFSMSETEEYIKTRWK